MYRINRYVCYVYRTYTYVSTVVDSCISFLESSPAFFLYESASSRRGVVLVRRRRDGRGTRTREPDAERVLCRCVRVGRLSVSHAETSESIYIPPIAIPRHIPDALNKIRSF